MAMGHSSAFSASLWAAIGLWCAAGVSAIVGAVLLTVGAGGEV
jgi:hypothetical protein